jgi:hypothetical protein
MATEVVFRNIPQVRVKRVSLLRILYRIVITFQRLTCNHDYVEFWCNPKHRADTKASVRLGVGICNMCGDVNSSLDSSFDYDRVVPLRQ